MIKQNLNSKKGKERKRAESTNYKMAKKGFFQQLYYREPTKSHVLF